MEVVSGSNFIDSLREKPVIKKEDNSGMLTQEDFFALMTQELAYQDPTKPTENSEMIGQLTAFSTSDGVSNLNDKFGELSASMTSGQVLQASSMVGRKVLVQNSSFTHISGQEDKGKYFSPEPIKDLTIDVKNEAGVVVKSMDLGDVTAGQLGFHWDGKNEDGSTPLESGSYTFEIKGRIDGVMTEIPAMTYRRVDSVTLAGGAGNVMLNLNGGGSLALDDVIEVAGG